MERVISNNLVRTFIPKRSIIFLLFFSIEHRTWTAKKKCMCECVFLQSRVTFSFVNYLIVSFQITSQTELAQRILHVEDFVFLLRSILSFCSSRLFFSLPVYDNSIENKLVVVTLGFFYKQIDNGCLIFRFFFFQRIARCQAVTVEHHIR